MAADNFISRGIQAYQSVVPNPAAQALLAGGALYGLSRLAWNPIVNTIRSLARVPGKAMSGLSDEEWDEAMDELESNSKYKKWVPVAIGGLAAAGSFLPSFKANKQYWGLGQWNPRTSYYHRDKNQLGFNSGLPKAGSVQKCAEDLFSFDGYVPAVDFSQTVNTRNAVDLFTNDPFLKNHQYAKNMATAIVADAANRTGTNNTTLGTVFDSAVNKIENKLSFSGLAEVGVKTVLANAGARLFTGALGAMTGLSPESQRTLIDAGTWAGAITAILE
jgi:hypothetical protein